MSNKERQIAINLYNKLSPKRQRIVNEISQLRTEDDEVEIKEEMDLIEVVNLIKLSLWMEKIIQNY